MTTLKTGKLRARLISSPELYLFAVALILNVAFMAFTNRDPLHADALQFNNEAVNLVSGRGWVNTEGTGFATTTYPAYVIFLVICKFIFGTHNYFVPVLLQHLMMAISVVLLYRICRAINLSLKISLLSGIILILFHNLYKSASVLNTQTLGYFLPVLFFYICIKHKSFGYSVLAGFLLGLSILTRFTYQYVPIVLAVFAILFRRKEDYPFLLKGYKFISLIVVCILVISPWFYWVSSKNGGTSGYSDAWNMMYKFNAAPDREFATIDSLRATVRNSELAKEEQEEYFRNLTFQLLKHKPFNFVRNMMTNTTAMLIHSTWQKSTIANPYTAMYYSMLLGYGLLGIFALTKLQHLQLLPMYGFSLVTYVVHVLVYGGIVHFYVFWFAIIPLISSGLVISVEAVKSIRSLKSRSG